MPSSSGSSSRRTAARDTGCHMKVWMLVGEVERCALLEGAGTQTVQCLGVQTEGKALIKVSSRSNVLTLHSRI